MHEKRFLVDADFCRLWLLAVVLPDCRIESRNGIPIAGF